uniref:Major facilitator superfamily (MFS) profile domain-containing protein n=1 Tax=Aegilops tauschii subsp. strangulata TaxID=200361 RepID=A0A453A096_AEGTS
IEEASHLHFVMSMLSLAGLVAFVLAFSLGMGAIPWIIMSEILPVNIKSLAGSTATLANWMTSWLITMTASLMLNWSNGGQSIPPSLSQFLATSFMTPCLTTYHPSGFEQEPLLYTPRCPWAPSSSCACVCRRPREGPWKRSRSRSAEARNHGA